MSPEPLERSNKKYDNPWREEPLPLREFVESEKHLSSGSPISLFPNQVQDLQAFLGSTPEDAKLLFSQTPPTPYNCAILCWGKGSGKSLSSSICLAWFVHVLFCLHNPQEFLGLAPDEAIDLALCSPTLRQTRRITFAKLKNRLRSWQWLRERIEAEGFDSERYFNTKIGADYIELPHSIRIHNLPLQASSSEGFSILAFAIDELAGLVSDAESSSATELFNTFVTSARSRFKKGWKGFCIGFPRSVNDPQEQLIAAAEAGKFPGLYLSRRATWEINPHLKREDFEEEELRNPEDFAAKFGARPMAASQNFFRSPDLIVKHASGGDRQLLRQFFPDEDEERFETRCSRMPDPIIERDRLGDIVLNNYGFPTLARWFRPKRDRQGDIIPVTIHIDVGVSRDSTGIAIASVEHTPDEKYYPVIDLAFRWRAAHFAKFGEIRRHNWRGSGFYTDYIEAAEIDLQCVTDFVIWLKVARGFDIDYLSCDGFNSAQLMQLLRNFDIPVGLHVADKPDFDELKSVIYARNLKYRCDRILFEELKKLELHNGKKVEAPRTKLGDSATADSHKELADCCAVVVARLCWQLGEGVDLYEFVDEVPANEKTTREITSGSYGVAQQNILKQFFDG